MGQPDVDVRQADDGSYEVEVNGFDYFDTAKGELGQRRQEEDRRVVARHRLRRALAVSAPGLLPDGGCEGRLVQAYERHPGRAGRDLLDKFHGTVSLPFEAGENRKVAVKIVDDRGIESLKIIALG